MRERRAPRRPAVGLALVAAAVVTVGVVWWKASTPALWFDEIFTAEVASLEGPAEIVHRLLEGADTHPPLDYLLRHGTVAVFGRSELAVRLLSAPLLLLGCLALYAYLRRFSSPAGAAFGFLLPLTTVALDHSLEARPYTLLFTGMAGALWAWARVRERPSLGNAALLSAVLGANVLGHYYGVFAFVPVAAGIAHRAWQRKGIDARHVAALAGGALVAAAAVPFAMAARRMGFVHPPREEVSAAALVLRMAGNAPLAALLAAALSLLASRAGRRHDAQTPDQDVTAEVVPILAALAVPAFVFALSKVTGLLQVRYTMGGVAGLAALAAVAVDRLARDAVGARRSAVVSVVLTVAYGLLTVAHPNSDTPRAQREADARALAAWMRGVEGPVVISHPGVFLELYTHLGQDARQRVVFPVSAGRALEALGHDSGDRVLPGLARINGMRTPPFEDFLAANPRFALVDAGRWFPRAVLEDPAFSARPLAGVLGWKAWDVRRTGQEATDR